MELRSEVLILLLVALDWAVEMDVPRETWELLGTLVALSLIPKLVTVASRAWDLGRTKLRADAVAAFIDLQITALFGMLASALLTPLIGADVDHLLAVPEVLLGFTQADLVVGAEITGLRPVLDLAYSMIFVQSPVLAVYCVVSGNPRPLQNLSRALRLCTLVGVALYVVMPAVGAWEFYGHVGPKPLWTDSLHALRAGGNAEVPLTGCIACPSFHAILSVLFTRAWAKTRLWVGGVVLNGVMLASAWPCGAHYLTDLAVGVALAVLVARHVEG